MGFNSVFNGLIT